MIEALKRERGLKIECAEDGEMVIPGRHGHLYEHGPGVMGLCLSGDPPGVSFTPRKWGYVKRACVEAGMQLHQDGDFEGVLLFDPTDSPQVDLAIKKAGVRRRRVLSPEHKARLKQAGRAHRFSREPGSNGHDDGPERTRELEEGEEVG